MPNTYNVGDLPRISTVITVDGAATDPTTLTFTLIAPNAAVTTYVYSTDAQLVRSAVGQFYVDVNVTQNGVYQYTWTSTGTAQNVESDYFVARQAFALVGGQDVLARARLVIGDNDSSAYEFSNQDMFLFLQNAVDVYQTLRPYKKETTITLVANQSDYALPSDCVRPLQIPYRQFPSLSGSPGIVTLWGLNGFLSIVPYRDWTDNVLTSIQSEYTLRFEHLGAGQSEFTTYLTSYTATRYLRLYPTPTSTGSFVLRYQANHPLVGNDYFTISPNHAIYIQKLLIAEVYDARYARQQSGVQEFNAGTTKIKVGGNGRYTLSDMADDLRQQARDALTSPIGRIG